MPERVTRQERQISLLIEKARKAKEILNDSVNDNNRSPMKDESEEFKLKRPKAEKYEPKFVSNDGPVSNHAYAGEIIKQAIIILKAVTEEDYNDNPFLNDEAREKNVELERSIEQAHEQMSKILADLKAGKTNIWSQFTALVNQMLTLRESKGGFSNPPKASVSDAKRSVDETPDPKLDDQKEHLNYLSGGNSPY